MTFNFSCVFANAATQQYKIIQLSTSCDTVGVQEITRTAVSGRSGSWRFLIYVPKISIPLKTNKKFWSIARRKGLHFSFGASHISLFSACLLSELGAARRNIEIVHALLPSKFVKVHDKRVLRYELQFDWVHWKKLENVLQHIHIGNAYLPRK